MTPKTFDQLYKTFLSDCISSTKFLHYNNVVFQGLGLGVFIYVGHFIRNVTSS